MIPVDVVIPALDAQATLAATLDRLLAAGALQVRLVVVDGGSNDGTRAITEVRGVEIIDAARGRGSQLAAGADHGNADWLFFIHADSLPGPGWDSQIAAFAADPANCERAGVFNLRFDDPSRSARRVEAIAAWRSRLLGLPYGDQGLVMSRTFYQALGGFEPLPIMEDVDLARRIGRRRLVTLDGAMTTSAERYRRAGYARRMARNLGCLTLYLLGLPPRLLVRLYG